MTFDSKNDAINLSIVFKQIPWVKRNAFLIYFFNQLGLQARVNSANNIVIECTTCHKKDGIFIKTQTSSVIPLVKAYCCAAPITSFSSLLLCLFPTLDVANLKLQEEWGKYE